jgi:hypothetical protein
MDSQRNDRPGVESPQGGHSVAQPPRDLPAQVIAMMTTEHYTLQSGRAMTIADANGRASLFLGTVSTSLVALAFIGGISRSGGSLGLAFYLFGLVLFPSLAFLGLVTFERVLQSAMEDLVYARGINRIRHLYQEHAPEMLPYFILSAHDDDAGVMGNLAMHGGWWQTFLSTAGMIVVINSVLVGTFIGLLIAGLPARLPLGAAIGAGLMVFLVSVFLHQRHQLRQASRTLGALRPRFPSRSDT